MAAALTAAPAAHAAPSEQCDTQTIQGMAPADTTVAFAGREGANCGINGYVTTTNPGPNKVLFVLVLPDTFNGRYLYLGVGGAAGALPPIPPTLLAKGYALSGSDGGTGAKSGADFSFMSDPGKAADFAGRGVQVTAVATQQITRTYYGRQQITRYISGCSGGGQMGMTNARRFGGQNFDGFLVGATPWPVSAYMPQVYRIAQHLQMKPEGWIPPELTAKAAAAILAAYDASDGAIDGVIHDQRDIANFDEKILRQVGFTPAQIETFELIHQPHSYSGPGFKGTVVNPGYPVTDVAGWSNFLLGRKTSPWPGSDKAAPSAIMASGAPYIHIMADTQIRAKHPGVDYWLAKPADLTRYGTEVGGENRFDGDPMDYSALANSHSKMIVYHGVNDQAMSYLETIAGYELLQQRMPQARLFVRAFAVPGLLHCRGGVGPTTPDEDLLEALANWVEKGVEPETVVSVRFSPTKGIERNFRLCAEPNRAVLKKQGLDPMSADNWECRAPAAAANMKPPKS
jgi:feruloyl esterase